MKYKLTPADSVKGIIGALAIISVWFISLVIGLTLQISELSFWQITLMIAWQTFLYTGLFITAHDAMHGIVFPKGKKINKIFGRVAVLLYALFSYNNLLIKHHQHHKNPGTEDDPDFHDGQHKSFMRWYFHFMLTYVTWVQIIGMAIVFNILLHLLHIPAINLIIFWILPALLSTLQLFYFGTFLPHRKADNGFKDEHRARSNNYDIILSFITCYHFGYHWEHHAFPYVPWWKLPKVRKEMLAKVS
ncbi:MAG: fatty acid desaturase [Calditrichaceae bacterium]